MRALAPALLLFAMACASRDGVIDERVLDCNAGGDVSVDVAMNAPGVAFEQATDHFTMVVEVGNNSHSDIEVRAIRVEPSERERASYAVERSYRKFGTVLAGGESHRFELPMMGRSTRDANIPASEVLGVVVSVYLGNGDTYRCELNTRAPR